MAKILQLFNEADLPLLQKSRAKSPCPFLTSREVDFLWVLYTRTATHMKSPYTNGKLSVEGENLARAGYTSGVHREFREKLIEPETLTTDFLYPVLRTLQCFYDKILRKEFECKRNIFEAYESWFNILPINPEVAKGVERELKSLNNDNNYCRQRISTLVTINNNIRALLHRPASAEINRHPTFDRSIA